MYNVPKYENKDFLITEIAKKYVIEKLTVRKCARIFLASKSTIHNWLKNDLKEINFKLWQSVQQISQENKKEATIRGGKATAEKYKKMREEKNNVTTKK